ncbi:PAS domain S-box protein [Candidatus Poribacteria bacterium]|nr:PAS domain S-box protein [Candidatus Poribacteria bacterium]
MNALAFACVFICVVHIGIGTSVFLKAPDDRTNRAFFLAIIALVLWILFHTAQTIYWEQVYTRIVFTKLAYVCGMLTCGLVAAFCVIFSNKRVLVRNPLGWIFTICTVFIVVASLPGNLLEDYGITTEGVINVPGPLQMPFYASEGLLFVFGLCHLMSRYKETRLTEEKRQLKMLGAGILIPASASLISLAVLPRFLGNSPLLLSAGPISTTAFIIMTGYAISRRGLFIEVGLALEYVFNSVVVGICVTQSGGRIVRCNHALTDMLECETDLTGRSLDELIALIESKMGERLPSPRRWFEACQPESFQVTLPGLGGKSLDLVASRLMNDKGKAVGSVFLFHDISEHKRLEEEIERTRVKFTKKRARGWIDVASTRMCLLDIAGGWKNLFERLALFAGDDTARRVIFEAGNSETFTTNALRGGFLGCDAQSFVDAVETYAESGYGDFTIRSLEWEKGYALIRCCDTFEGWSYRSSGQLAAEPVCNYSRGVLLSFMQHTTQLEGLECVETMCVACGDDACEFIVATKERLSEMGIKIPCYGMSIKEKADSLRNLLEEKERLEKEMRSSEEKYRMLVENANDIIYSTDPYGNITFINQVVHKIAGYTTQELLGKNFRALIAPDEEEKILRYARGAYKGKPQRYEARVLHKDGRALTLQNFLGAIMRNGAVTGFSIIARDVTETKQLEQQVKESEEKYRNLVEESGDVVYIMQDGALKFLNEIGLERSGYTREELFSEGFDPFQLVHPEDRALVADAVNRLSQEGQSPERVEARFVTKKGEVIDFILTGTSLTYEGKPASMGVLVDITEKKRLQERLVQSEKLASIGQLVSGVAHELNNPLAAIMGYAELFSQSKTLSAREQNTARRIFESSERCKRIIQNLLSFARQRGLTRANMNICDVVEKAIELREYDLKARNIKVQRNYDADHKSTVCDAQQLQSVFLNLINNASDAMYEANRSGVLRIGTLIDGDVIVIDFTDDGPGVPTNIRDRIFDPFFTTKEVGKGTGLGLSISYGIIREHGGELFMDSKYSGGARFVVRLPIVQAVHDSEAASDEAPALLESKSKPRILVVDDETTILDLSVDILSDSGYEVDTAHTGSEAKGLIESKPYDLVITDVRMPGALSGIDLYYWAKKAKPGIADKIIFMTGDIVADETQRFLRDSRLPYLSKPFEISKYVGTIQKVLSHQAGPGL